MTNFVITLKWVLLVITLTQINADDTHGIVKRDTNREPKKIVCYYTNWSVYRPGTAKFTPQNINPYLCTHLIYAFGGLDKENGLRPYDKYQDIEQGGYAKFTGLKTYNKNLKTMLAIGGWNEGSSRFSNLVADEDRRTAFVKNVVKFLRQNHFDGLDLDWEYPAFRDGSKPSDKENYASLVKELRDEFEKESSKTGKTRLLLTMAVPAGVEYIDKGYDIPKLNKYLDFMNILSYDYHSAYEPSVNHHSPLHSLQEESEYNFDAQLTIDYTIKHYLKKGADPEKLILGIPTYGRSYSLLNVESTDLGSPADGPGEQGVATREKGYLAYYEICANVENNNTEWKVIQPKRSAMGPFAYSGNQWVGYDDVDIIKHKAKYANEKKLGGIMYWSIDNDDFRGKCHGKPYPLIEAGKTALLANSGTSDNAISATTEEKRKKLVNRKNRPKHHSTTSNPQSTTILATTASTTLNPLSTPEPPTTPDPGTDFVCKEEGFFPHPRDCKKYFWCLDSGPSNLGIVAHQFTCPSGLMFNKATDSCDYSRNVICSKKTDKTTTTPATKSTTVSSSQRTFSSTTSTTTSTTTPEPPIVDEYEDEEIDQESEEDPNSIKQLITLIQELGGIDELKKQLKIKEGSKEATTPAISKSLYNKVFSSPSTSRFRNQHRSGSQTEGLTSTEDVPYKKDKPQYVTIQRSRPIKHEHQDTEDSGTTNNKAIELSRGPVDYADNADEEDAITLKYSSLSRSQSPTERRSSTPKYIVLERHRPDRTTTEVAEELESPSTSTSRYITLVRNRPSTVQNEVEESITETTQHTRLTTKATEPSTERVKDKVSESEVTTPQNTPTQTLTPVTSAQNETNSIETPNLAKRVVEPTTNSTNTYLVYAQTVPDAYYTKENDIGDFSTEIKDSTEPFSISIATTVFTTIRESATEVTRIPLKMYNAFIKKNRTQEHNDLATNLVSDSKPKYSVTSLKSNPEATSRQPFFRGRKLNNSTITSSTLLVPESTTQSWFQRRKSNFTTSFHPQKSHNNTDSSGESRHNWFRGTTTESNYDSFFKKRRSSTTTENPEILVTTLHSRGGYRYSYRSRKPVEVTSTELSSPKAQSRFSMDKFAKKKPKAESLGSHENIYYDIQDSTPSDQLSESDSNEENITDKSAQKNTTDNADMYHNLSTTEKLLVGEPSGNRTYSNQTTSKVSSTSEHTQSTGHKVPLVNHFHQWARTTPNSTFQSSTHRLPSNLLKHKNSSQSTHRLPSEFLKNRPSTEPSGTKSPDLNFRQRTTSSNLPEAQTEPQRLTHEHFRHRTTTASPSVEGQDYFEHETSSAESIEDESSSEPASKSYSNHFRTQTSSRETSTQGSSTQGKPIFASSSFQPIRVEEFFHRTSRLPITTLEIATSSRPESSVERETYSRVNPRNNSRFLKNPEWEYKQQERRHKTNSPVYLIQKSNQDQVGFEVQIDHGEKASRMDLNSALTSQRSRKKFSSTQQEEEQASEENNRPSRTRLNSSPQQMTVRPQARNRGSIKARNSLSRAEIKELTYLIETPNRKPPINHPINKIEEAPFDVSIRSQGAFTPRHRFEETMPNSGSLDFNRLYTLPNERLDEDNSFVSETPNVSGFRAVPVPDVFRVSETKYGNEGTRYVFTTRERVAENGTPRSTQDGPLEQSSRVRGNFRRNNPSHRYRTTLSTNTTTTTLSPTTVYPFGNSNNQNSRFRRRKGRPENRSINPVKSEPFIPPEEVETSTVTRHKNYDISHRGSAIVSDYLPVPESLYRANQTNFDQLNAENLNLQDIDAQTITNNNYNVDVDVSDLANPAVVAITNLKTVPPVAPQPRQTYAKAITAAPQIIYTTEPQYQLFTTKAATIRTAAPPVYQTRIAHSRGNTKSSLRRKTTTVAPSLQDIYNDYHESDIEYHAEPVEIPITGKVRIHSDGYIECLDMGNFPHPFSCRKFISCAKMEYDTLLGWEYTCPKGLSFDPIGGICNWAAGLGCKD